MNEEQERGNVFIKFHIGIKNEQKTLQFCKKKIIIPIGLLNRIVSGEQITDTGELK